MRGLTEGMILVTTASSHYSFDQGSRALFIWFPKPSPRSNDQDLPPIGESSKFLRLACSGGEQNGGSLKLGVLAPRREQTA